jgi:hypothetical protein
MVESGHAWWCSKRARPAAVRTTRPSRLSATILSASASSQAQFKGQVLLHATRTSATPRPRRNPLEELRHQEFCFGCHADLPCLPGKLRQLKSIVQYIDYDFLI